MTPMPMPMMGGMPAAQGGMPMMMPMPMPMGMMGMPMPMGGGMMPMGAMPQMMGGMMPMPMGGMPQMTGMPPMMMNGMPMMMAMPVMCRMSCEMTKDGMVCKLMPMDASGMDAMTDRCNAMNAMMAMGMPVMMSCAGMPMLMGAPAATK